ncbi:hypothetical protein CQW29_18545 [Pantoea coffeiphila]|uniref:Uncharacterized protein n=1 Tax=Pantoea coffeiphila TaxID=1465635 RepID=A0A2S9I8D2_9GAMM|nr:hypothetical protein CQW29_18545 [Pantoea coffeiphila]
MHIGEPRFPDTIVCGQCNSADGTVKRKLNLPKSFSFSPSEIRVFIKARPHEKHDIDHERALNLFNLIINSSNFSSF